LVKHWLCITNEKNWNVAKEKNIWGVSERNKENLWAVKEGDMLVFYVKTARLGGIFEAVSKPYEDLKKLFHPPDHNKNEVFPYHIRLKPILVPKHMAEFKPLIPKLDFISHKGKRARAGHLYGKNIAPISEEDYKKWSLL